MDYKEWIKGIFVPGYIFDSVRVVYFLIFLVLTVVQTTIALQLEEEIAEDTKYSKVNPNDLQNDW